MTTEEMKLYSLEESWEVPLCVFAKSPQKALELLMEKYGYNLMERKRFTVHEIPKDEGRVVESSGKIDLLTCDTTNAFLLELRTVGISEWIEFHLDSKYTN